MSVRGRRRISQGFSLGFVLLMIAMLLMVVMTMAAVATTTLNLSRNSARTLEANYLAETAALHALSKIHRTPAFGAANEQVYLQPDRTDKTRWGLVTFNTASKFPYSTNNLDGGNSTGYANAAVPAGTVRLLSTGESAGVRRTVEMFARVPRFPYVLAVGEALASSGGLDVRAASSMADFADQEAGAGTPGQSASVAAAATVNLGGVSHVTGDVVCPGAVTLAEGSTVGGVIRDGVIDLPNMDPDEWDPGTEAGVETMEPVYQDPITRLEGKRYLSDGSLRFDGDLVLDNALVYVRGNLTVAGSVSGRGALIVEGDTQVSGGSSLSSDHVVALVCAGNVTLKGSPSTRTYFQGLVYARGDFTASDLSIAGVFVSGGGLGIGGKAGTGGTTASGDMNLSNVEATYVPEVAEITMNFDPKPPDSLTAPPVNYRPPGSSTPLYVDNRNYDRLGAVTDGGFTLRADGNYFVPKYEYPPGVGKTLVDVELPNFGPKMVDAVLKDMQVDAVGDFEFIRPAGKQFYLRKTEIDGARFIDMTHVYLDSQEGREDMDGAALVIQVIGVVLDADTGRYKVPATPSADFYIMGSNGKPSKLLRQPVEQIAVDAGTSVDEMIAFMMDRQVEAMNVANDILDGTVPMGGASVLVDLSLNKFLGDATPLRVSSWRDY